MTQSKAEYKPLVSFLTVNFNQPQVTVDLLKSLEKLNYENWEAIVVDNGSNESDLEKDISQCNKVKYVKLGKNLGFAGGNNAGLSSCEGEYIFFVNNDLEVEPDLLDDLIVWAEKVNDLGIVSPKIRYFHNKKLIQFAGANSMSRISVRNSSIGWKEEDKGQYNHVRETAYIHGAAMLIPKKTLDLVGPMYDEYFLYYEEYDWCEMIRRAGLKIYYYGKVKVWHKESVSTGTNSPLKIYYLTRNRLLYARRNNKLFEILLSFVYFGLVAVPKNVISWTLKGRLDLAFAFLKGYWWNLTHKSGR